jgi:hypothetical protein
MVLAKFSWWRGLAILAGGITMLAILYSPLLWDQIHGRWGIFLILAWLLGVPFGLLMLALLRQFVFRARAAIWVDGGELFYLNEHFMRARKQDIVSIEPGIIPHMGTKFRSVQIRHRDGKVRSIATGPLEEAPGVILERVREWLR